jgi:hypothetical protein
MPSQGILERNWTQLNAVAAQKRQAIRVGERTRQLKASVVADEERLSLYRPLLERAAVSIHFPEFHNAAALAHLAHAGRGARYVLIGGKAWYDSSDIRSWLEANKRCRPPRSEFHLKSADRVESGIPRNRKRGRQSVPR